MLDRADALLKLALALAALFLGAGVGFYYGMFLPEQAARTDAAAATAAKAQADAFKQVSAQKDASLKAAQSDYDACVSLAVSNYNSRWTSSCQVQHDRDEHLRTNCLNQGLGDQACSSIEVRSASDCSLSSLTGDEYDSNLKSEKEICLEKLKAGRS